MSVDSRVAVALGLRRLVEGGAWPAGNLVTFQNLLLDQAGGDTRPLVALLLRAVEQGVPEDLVTVPPGEWARRRPQFVARLTSNAFVRQDMATWAVHAWAHALGREPSPAVSAPAPPPVERAVDVREGPRWGPRPAPVTVPPAAQRPRTTATRGRRLPATSRASGPITAQDRRRDLATIAAVGVVMLATQAPLAWVVLTRSRDSTLVIPPVAAPKPAPAPPKVPGAFAGRYRIERTLESVTGDPSCSAGVATARWPVPSTEVIIHDSASSTFQFQGRPEVRGRVSPDGGIVVGPVYGENDGMSYAFQMVGRFSKTGLEARVESSTITRIAWLRQERCHMTGRLIGHRIE